MIILLVSKYLLTVTVSLDLAAASFALGSAKVKIPLSSAFILSTIDSLSLTVPCMLSSCLINIVNPNICSLIGKTLLILLGIFMLAKNLAGKKISKNTSPLSVIIDESDAEKADCNRDKFLSPFESIILGTGLSTDSLVTGISAGLTGVDFQEALFMLLSTFTVSFIFVKAFSNMGNKISSKVRINTSVLCGLIMIIIALFI